MYLLSHPISPLPRNPNKAQKITTIFVKLFQRIQTEEVDKVGV